MLASFYRYLLLNQRACMPGVGVFSVERTPAAFDAAAGEFMPPRYAIQFRSGNEMADKKFYTFLKHEHQIDEVSAIRQFNELSCAVWETLHEKKRVRLPGVGELIFAPDEQLNLVADPHLEKLIFPVKPGTVSLPAPGTTPVAQSPAKPKAVAKKERKKKEESVSTTGDTNGVLPIKDYRFMLGMGLAVLAMLSILLYYTVVRS